MWLPQTGAMARLARDLPAFLRQRADPARAAGRVRHRLATREGRFLALAERAIFANPRSPHRRLLAAVGCEPADLGALVRREGLEPALEHLAGLGVYCTFDEFKGRRPIVRGSTRIECVASDFDGPVPPHIEARTGGSRSTPLSVHVSLAFLAELAESTALTLDAHGLGQHRHALWLQGAFAGLLPALIYARLGRPPAAWYHPLRSIPLSGRLAVRWVCAVSRLSGSRIAAPRYNDLHDVRALANLLAGGPPTCVTTHASGAVRVAVAAREAGLDLGNVCFVTLGEPYTAAKRDAILASGARGLPRYAFTEGGIAGYGCAAPREPDDMHVLADCLAAVQRRRPTSADGAAVDAFLFTSLLPSAPKVLLNVETGDHGRLERRECGCALGALGLTQHVVGVRSFEKLSGEGISFVEIDLLRILEHTLPARFGGGSGDYQVVEEEGEDGVLRTALVVSPRLGAVDEDEVREAFLGALGRTGGFDRVGAEMWRRAGTVEVRRQWPLATGAGKVLPFHVTRGATATPSPGRS